MGVGIDEAGQNEHPAKVKLPFGLPGGGQRFARPHGGHHALIDGQGAVFNDAALHVLRDEDARVEKRVAVLHE